MLLTLAARNLIYNPNEKALAFIKAVVKNLLALMNKNDFTSFNFIDFINSDEQRQTSESGTAQEYYLLFKSNDVALSLPSHIEPFINDLSNANVLVILSL